MNFSTPYEFKRKVNDSIANGDNSVVVNLIGKLLDRVDEIAADLINGIKSILPSVLYFLNSNGLKTSLNNLVLSVDTVLGTVCPLFSDKPMSVVSLINVDLENFTANGIIDLLVDLVNDKLSLNLKAPAVDLLTELSTGKVVSYVSANGETYYTMKYAPTKGKVGDEADLTTAVFRLLLAFISEKENREQIKSLVNSKVSDETARELIGELIDAIVSSIKDDKSMGLAMKIFYEGLSAISKAVDKVDDAYHNVSNTWGFAA